MRLKVIRNCAWLQRMSRSEDRVRASLAHVQDFVCRSPYYKYMSTTTATGSKLFDLGMQRLIIGKGEITRA